MIGDSPHKGPVMWKVFPCHDVIMMETELTDQLRMVDPAAYMAQGREMRLSYYPVLLTNDSKTR